MPRASGTTGSYIAVTRGRTHHEAALSLVATTTHYYATVTIGRANSGNAQNEDTRMTTVTETIEQAIEQMTTRADAMKAGIIKLDAGIKDHYEFLGRQYYDERRLAREASRCPYRSWPVVPL